MDGEKDMAMTIEKRISKIAIELHPFRDTTCAIKTMSDRALQSKLTKWMIKYFDGQRHEQVITELQRIEDLIKETR